MQKRGFAGLKAALGIGRNKTTTVAAPARAPKATVRTAAVKTSPTPKAKPVNPGAVASSLKGLNAAHASLTAMANASPNSRVGRIAAYREALIGVGATTAALAAASESYSLSIDAMLAATAVEVDPAAVTDPTTDVAPTETVEAAPATTTQDVMAALEALGDEATEAQVREVLAGYTTDEAAIDAVVEARATVADTETSLEGQQASLDGLLADAAAPHAPPALDSEAYASFKEMLRLDEDLPAPNGTDTAEADAALEGSLDSEETATDTETDGTAAEADVTETVTDTATQ